MQSGDPAPTIVRFDTKVAVVLPAAVPAAHHNPRGRRTDAVVGASTRSRPGTLKNVRLHE